MLCTHEALKEVNFPLALVKILRHVHNDVYLSLRGKTLTPVVTPLIRVFLRFVVHGLTTGEQYIFRVKAVNAVGTSENSQESDVIKVQAALSK